MSLQLNGKYLTKAQTLEYMAKGWILEFCSGSSLGSNWVWVRPKPGATGSLMVHMNAAKSLVASDLLEIDRKDKWNPVFRLRKSQPTPSSQGAGGGKRKGK